MKRKIYETLYEKTIRVESAGFPYQHIPKKGFKRTDIIEIQESSWHATDSICYGSNGRCHGPVAAYTIRIKRLREETDDEVKKRHEENRRRRESNVENYYKQYLKAKEELENIDPDEDASSFHFFG